jgi:hypothetical protein
MFATANLRRLNFRTSFVLPKLTIRVATKNLQIETPNILKAILQTVVVPVL